MKNTHINALIRECLKPVLIEAGFSQFTTRSAWRYQNQRIDVFRFQLHKVTDAVGSDVRHTFSLELGCMLDYMPCLTTNEPVRIVQNEPRPEIFHCTFQRTLQGPEAHRPVGQPYAWKVPTDFGSLKATLQSAARALESEGFLWYQQFDDPRDVLELLSSPEERRNGTWGYGRAGTPMRQMLIGLAALKAGFYDLAQESLHKIQASPGFPYHSEAISDALVQIEGLIKRRDAA